MNCVYSLVWNRTKHELQVASELARGACKGKSKTGQRTRVRAKTLGTAFALTLAGILGIAQAADVIIDADGETKTLNSSDTYTKIEATNGGTVDAEGNQVTISGAVAGGEVVEIDDNSTLILDGGGTLENTNTTDARSHALEIYGTGSSARLNSVIITTNAEQSFGIFTDGAQVELQDGVDIIIKGDGAIGIFADANSSITMTGGSITTRAFCPFSSPL